MFQISLEAARVNANLTQKMAAERIGVDPSTLRNWESGRNAPDAYKFKALCELYGCPMDAIFLPNRLT